MAGPDAQPTTLSDVLQTKPGQTTLVASPAAISANATDTAKVYAKDTFNSYFADGNTGESVMRVSGTGDNAQVLKLVPDTSASSSSLPMWQEQLAKASDPQEMAFIQEQIDKLSVSGGMKWETDVTGTQLLRASQSAEAAAKAAAAGIGAARSYLDTENDKTAEITRQFNDFENRASALYDLQDSEQQYGMKADDQNAQNRLAIAKGALFSGETPVYLNDRPGALLSEILGPSLPDYVSPDYRLNAAVGLPGAEGFNDPQYDANGMPIPQYAWGTESNRSRIEAIAYQYLHGPRFQDEPPAPWHSSAGVMRRA